MSHPTAIFLLMVSFCRPPFSREATDLLVRFSVCRRKHTCKRWIHSKQSRWPCATSRVIPLITGYITVNPLVSFPNFFFSGAKTEMRWETGKLLYQRENFPFSIWHVIHWCPLFFRRDLCSSVHFEWATSCFCWENNTSSVASYVPSPAAYPVSEFTARARRNGLDGKES